MTKKCITRTIRRYVRYPPLIASNYYFAFEPRYLHTIDATAIRTYGLDEISISLNAKCRYNLRNRGVVGGVGIDVFIEHRIVWTDDEGCAELIRALTRFADSVARSMGSKCPLEALGIEQQSKRINYRQTNTLGCFGIIIH